MSTPLLFSPLALRDLVLRNRIAMPPMCQYSAEDGFANDWHLVHYGSRAALGVGLIVVEATAVEPRGRISPNDLGLWKDGQIAGLKRIADHCRGQGAAIGIQLAHAGRKAGTARPWDGGLQLARAQGGWERVSASTLAFKEGEELPRALDKAGLEAVVAAFADSARRALAAGFDLVEVHAAHGYLLHQFLSPLSNKREDEYGGAFENRARLLLEVVDGVRSVWPAAAPLLVRLSATDWAAGGWDLPECAMLCSLLKAHGVDLIDVSSGGLVATQAIKPEPGFQVPFAAEIRRVAAMPTGAVGLITEAEQAESVLAEGKADLVFIGRELLRNPGWAFQALRELGASAFDGRPGRPDAGIAPQYLRAKREWK